jgi:hypothetical protein
LPIAAPIVFSESFCRIPCCKFRPSSAFAKSALLAFSTAFKSALRCLRAGIDSEASQASNDSLMSRRTSSQLILFNSSFSLALTFLSSNELRDRDGGGIPKVWDNFSSPSVIPKRAIVEGSPTLIHRTSSSNMHRSTTCELVIAVIAGKDRISAIIWSIRFDVGFDSVKKTTSAFVTPTSIADAASKSVSCPPRTMSRARR